jgi:hypothetical protein
MVALFTNNVGGCTGTLGFTTTMNGVCPALGVASAVAHDVPTGPFRPPTTMFTCAAITPSPANPSPP